MIDIKPKENESNEDIIDSEKSKLIKNIKISSIKNNSYIIKNCKFLIPIIISISVILILILKLLISNTKENERGIIILKENDTKEYINEVLIPLNYSKYKIQGNNIKTKFINKVNISNPWPSYPRKQLERKGWMNLNGLWNFSIIYRYSLCKNIPDGQILVPYPLESSLSGTLGYLTEYGELCYSKIIKIPKDWKDKKIILNFGAVDWQTQLFINNMYVGIHTGGYTPFSFDITDYLNVTKENIIIIKVYDPSDQGNQPIGKQSTTNNYYKYSTVTGIWQTVWMEAVNRIYIKNISIFNNFDKKLIGIKIATNDNNIYPAKIMIYYEERLIREEKGESNKIIKIILKDEDFHPWSPDEPNLYQIKIKLLSKDKKKIYDSVKSYTAIRKIQKKKDSMGNMRFYLNNKIIYMLGVLDQGYFPDGLYTAPSEEAMLYDLYKIKDLGFNTIRKHMKVEPALYYYYTDKLGILVWQDMVADENLRSDWKSTSVIKGKEIKRSNNSKINYYKEWKDILNFCKFFQSIVMWVPFNEGWGQFDTKKVVNFTKNIDNTRLINEASGGIFQKHGDILDFHSYPDPEIKEDVESNKQVNIFGEFGGLGLIDEKHRWSNELMAYKYFKNKKELSNYYVKLIEKLINLVEKGISGAIYTQTTDIEKEINGLMTYDRKVMKVDEKKIRNINLKLINSLKE